MFLASVYGTHCVNALNLEATLRKYMTRLIAAGAEVFAATNNAWIQHPGAQEILGPDNIETRGFYGFGAEVMPALMVYYAAVHHGWKPLGLVPVWALGSAPLVNGSVTYVGPDLPSCHLKRYELHINPVDHVMLQHGDCDGNAK
jgi:hypothetical protein